MLHEVDVRAIQKFGDQELQALSDVLIDCVEGRCLRELHVADDPRQGADLLA
jgi:hypothetical protein